MRKSAFVLLALTTVSCAPPQAPPGAPRVTAPDPVAVSAASPAVDDGSYLERIDPLGGQWMVERLAGQDFRRFDARISFTAGGFLNHGAGCGGGHPAFYRLDGGQLAITRREPVRIGKCERSPAGPAAAAASERDLGSFLDRVASWERRAVDTLLLRDQQGGEALLTRPVEPQRDIAGRWLIESIGGRPFVTERPANVTVARGTITADADCNRMSANFSVPRPGVLAISGGVIGTQRGCAPQDLAEDELLGSAIGSATSYRLDRERLVIGGGPGMVLCRPPARDRRLAGDYEHCGDTLLGGYHEGPVTLRFDGRRVTDNAGCVADYTASGPALTLRLSGGPACAAKATPYVPGNPVPIGGSISTLAVTRPDGFGFTETGVLVLRTGRGLLTLCRKGSPKPFGSG